MQKIPLPLARPGMVLEKPITRENGMVLVGEGTTLTDGLITRLENMDIKYVVVEGHPLADEGGTGGTASAQIKRLDHLFRKFEIDPWMMEVKAAIKSHWVRQEAVAKAKASTEMEHTEAEGSV
ncbi:MAG: hypothetical protein EOM25_05335 [Deltaproteobacteria bacterium]|nr:hypothetical protein [Deltaproteobacteria bacterium]